MIKVFQIELSDEKSNEVNAAGCWSKVAWGKTYLDLTMGDFNDSDNVSAMEMIIEAAEFGLIRHTMTIDTNDFDEAFTIGNGMGDDRLVEHHGRHKSASVGDIFIRTTGDGAVVANFGFEALSEADAKEIQTLVPQKITVA